ncbi:MULTISPECIES: GntR family transcriptional regulator [unclassified Leeuwenhoekiella]|uniref:GntR family transcriptional regulator n=1 Tax=unclassified Leeuwenhoekiella TaxID=2615029 RepID=UPI0004912370|nr:GntR family transcriptional regulator [Leeuwenhoekiella sp. MAR_2009_132]MDP5043847.1 GntR family transcriptional regulator [Leeuwenhoekiella sp.]
MARTVEIKINEDSRIPKYKQIVDSIIDDVAKGKLKVGQKIPSINELSEAAYLSRDTVEKAYKILKERKVIISVKGKGYYTAKTELISKINVFFLINKPSSYKMIIFNHFVNTLGVNAHVNLSIYHCEESLFINAIEKNIGAYNYYVIMPHFKDTDLNHVSFTPEVLKAIEMIPKDQLLVVDNTKPEIKGNYGSIYQDFKEDIYNALIEGMDRLKKYDRLILVYPSKSVHPYPRRIVHGFRYFCQKFDFEFEILDEIYEDMEFESKDVYITIEEMDLVNLLRQVRARNLVLGKDIGVISYNETPLKELLGITVVSTDFKAMGETAAYMILKNKKEKVKNVFKYIERNSV